ncbi:MAG TPA: hypothetical protein DCL43_13635 [Chitinophagaceae bacterium]|nr:hypothetical protein [Chitinophagaceae bacterium]
MRKFNYYVVLLTTLCLSIGQLQAQEVANTKAAYDLMQKNLAALNLLPGDINQLEVTDMYTTPEQVTMLYVRQTYRGIGIHNQMLVMAFRNDKLLNKSGTWLPKVSARVANNNVALSASDALRKAMEHLQLPGANIVPTAISDNGKLIRFNKANVAQHDILVQPIYSKMDDGTLRLSWLVELAPVTTADHWLMRIDATTGALIGKDNFTVYCSWEHPEYQQQFSKLNVVAAKNALQHHHKPWNMPSSLRSVNNIGTNASYTVIPYPAESPEHFGGNPTQVSNPWNLSPAGSNATTLGWHSDGTINYEITRGNNVYAQEDRDNNNNTFGIPGASTTASPNLSFNYNPNFALHPVTGGVNQQFAITNLFVWNNLMHDISYLYGFTEAAGNFQTNNLSRGGNGNDAVIADAQDGSGTNNANFSTPADGTRGRMQMFLWSAVAGKITYVSAPQNIRGFLTSVEGNISTANKLSTTGPVTGEVVLFRDNAAGTTNLACNAPNNSLTGKIALIAAGGTCSFAEKVLFAQNAGAIGVIVINTSNTPVQMGGIQDNTITIPAVMIGFQTGNNLRNALVESSVVVTLAPPTNTDSDYDNGIIAHEYAHGISTRLTGGPANSGCLGNAEQMGEGWSDYYSLMMTTNWASVQPTDGAQNRGIGTYVIGQNPVTGRGIRTYAYSSNLSINPWNFSQLSSIPTGRPHTVGEIWCATLWDMTWELIGVDGINRNFFNPNGVGGNSVAMKLVTEAMKLQPCGPGFLDGRDAILKADSIFFNGRYRCAIWNAFARRGMGAGAVQGSSNSLTDQLSDFSVPSSASVFKTSNITSAAQGQEVTYTLSTRCDCSPQSNLRIIDTLPTNVTWISGGTYNAANRTVTFNTINLNSGQTTDFTYRVAVNAGTFTPATNHVNEPINSNVVPAIFSTTFSGLSTWVTSSTRSYNNGFSLFTQNNTTPEEKVLFTLNGFTLNRVSSLSFWHYYITESGYDGGVVELSTDGGSTWFDAAPYITTNTYNGVIANDATGSTLLGRRAFTGNSGSFVNTIVNLRDFTGQSIRFRFRFASDNGTAGEGWYIDNIRLVSESAVYNKAELFNAFNNRLSIDDNIMNINNLTLPVVYRSFTAERQQNNALLQWSTTQEINASYFEVEHSINPNNGFKALGTVAAKGNSNLTVNYKFTHTQPVTGINYYRLKQFDKDGTFHYSEVRTLEWKANGPVITIAPNPAWGKLQVQLQNNTDVFDVWLVSAAGETVATWSNQRGNVTLALPTTLATGTYWIHCSNQQWQQVQPVFIQKP